MKRIAASFAALFLLCGAGPPRIARQPEIAITVDDLPVHAPYPPGLTPLQVNRQMIAALKADHVPVTAFVNGVNVKDAGTRQALSDWRADGFVLGNHSWSHPHLSDLNISQFEDELTRDEPILQKLGATSDWHWFRYPFLDEGKDESQRIAARHVLARHGYRIAAVTMSFSDWAFTSAYARCSAGGDKPAIAQIERLYLQSARENVAVSRRAAHKLFGRDIPYVLLMHVSALSAHMMPQVIRLYRDAGFRLVSLPEAEADPSYKGYTNLNLSPPVSPQQMAQEKHVRLEAAPDYQALLDRMCVA